MRQSRQRFWLLNRVEELPRQKLMVRREGLDGKIHSNAGRVQDVYGDHPNREFHVLLSTQSIFQGF